ncbi:MAG: D-alanine--D-alanine ligase [Bacteroidales bacterium]|nr:D-alanine--D-alanine ligase [Bacteroidales bacterium]
MKKNIAVIMGGNSGEHAISLKSGANIAQQLNHDLYNVYPIVLKGASWTYTDNHNEVFPIDKNDFSLHINGQHILFDCVFIAIHGNPGEDGRLQGYFDMLNIPYTGCSALISSLTFNKSYCNRVVASYGVQTAPSVHLFKKDHYTAEEIIAKTGLPCFVKPCNSGSSVGMSKVNKQEDLLPALNTAFQHDDQVLIETFVKGREITCGIMEYQGEIQVVGITEIVSKKEYFDFEAKYNPALANEITPARIPEDVQTACETTSKHIYRVLDCKGIVRIDYIFNQNGLYFIEVNTIPGQTNESLVPKQVKMKNLCFTDLCTYFLEEAMNTH